MEGRPQHQDPCRCWARPSKGTCSQEPPSLTETVRNEGPWVFTRFAVSLPRWPAFSRVGGAEGLRPTELVLNLGSAADIALTLSAKASILQEARAPSPPRGWTPSIPSFSFHPYWNWSYLSAPVAHVSTPQPQQVPTAMRETRSHQRSLVTVPGLHPHPSVTSEY